MMFSRPWLLFFVAGSLCGGIAAAQDSSGGAGGTGGSGSSSAGSSSSSSTTGSGSTGNGSTGSGSTGTGASSSFSAPTSPFAAPSNPSTPAAGSTGAQGAGLQNPSGQPAPNNGGDGNGAASTLPGTTQGTLDQSTTQGSASSFGAGQNPNGQVLQQAPATFTVPGFYGKGSQTFVVGEGRLARPKFRFSGSISAGYDDNVFQTPNHPQAVPAQKVQVEIAPATPAGNIQEVVPSGDPTIPASVQTVSVPAGKPVFRTVTIPEVPAQQRIGSWVTRTDAKMDMQFASRRTLFTFDLGGGVDYYWNQPGQKADYNGNLALIYLHKFSGRGQFTFTLTSSYQKQPDFSQPNTPSTNSGGSYLNTNAKADLTYRLTPRFSTLSSISYSDLAYEEQTQSNSHSETIGTELHYLFSPRLTLLGEVRYSVDTYPEQSTNDTSDYSVLFGGELALSRRFNASLRLGEEVQSFKEGGNSASSPRVEANMTYRLGVGTTLQWNAEYGYEASGSSVFRNLVARSGFQVAQIFSPRLQATFGLNLVHSSTKSLTVATTSVAASDTLAPNALGLSPNTVEDTIDASVGFYYVLDRHWSLNLSYTYTMTENTPQSFSDYFRQRIFLGASYQF